MSDSGTHTFTSKTLSFLPVDPHFTIQNYVLEVPNALSNNDSTYPNFIFAKTKILIQESWPNS